MKVFSGRCPDTSSSLSKNERLDVFEAYHIYLEVSEVYSFW